MTLPVGDIAGRVPDAAGVEGGRERGSKGERGEEEGKGRKEVSVPGTEWREEHR